MKRAMLVALGTGAILTSAAAVGVGAGSGTSPTLDPATYQAALRSVERGRELGLARCDSLALEEQEPCRTQAAARSLVRAAEIEADYRRDERSARALQRARIEARYQVDRSRCATMSGFRRDKCYVQAHATKGRAMLDVAAPYEVRYSP